MGVASSLGVGPGVTCVIGSGGKTTLIARLARELCSGRPAGGVAEDVVAGGVVVCTTTHIQPLDGMLACEGRSVGEVRDALASAAGRAPVQVASGASASDAPSRDGIVRLGPAQVGVGAIAGVAGHVLVEADGSRMLPLKAHATCEPVLPDPCELHDHAMRTILVAGMSGIGQRVRDAVHRPELFCGLAGVTPDDVVLPRHVARAIAAELACGRTRADTIVLNQADDAGGMAAARDVARELAVLLGSRCPHVLAGGVREGRLLQVG